MLTGFFLKSSPAIINTLMVISTTKKNYKKIPFICSYKWIWVTNTKSMSRRNSSGSTYHLRGRPWNYSSFWFKARDRLLLPLGAARYTRFSARPASERVKLPCEQTINSIKLIWILNSMSCNYKSTFMITSQIDIMPVQYKLLYK